MPRKPAPYTPVVPAVPAAERPHRVTEQPSPPPPAPCTTQYSLCDECRVLHSIIPREVGPSYLDCPENCYPVIFTCEIDGTKYKARELVEYFHTRMVGIFGRYVPVHAVVKKAAIGNNPAGPWLDLTTPGSNFATPFTPKVGLLTLPKYKEIIKQRMHAEYVKAHYKRRQVSILADLPLVIDAGGENEAMVKKCLPEWVEIKGPLQHPTASHPSAHRLRWWAETHPLTDPTEYAKKPPNHDPWARRNCQVRKKKY
ncbi:hypothetical protein BJX63DRAFT_436933 [Aspergillus granulosus]|uniref:Uncharacterized protein n=1 Tax=Aspergillus granulosus TaxID=176169 RepID=A0ABR4GWI3_9EURO